MSPLGDGFPGGVLSKNNIHREKTYNGFMTGDICLITIPKGKYQGKYIARIAIRHRPSFKFTFNGKNIDVNSKYCVVLQRNTGYDYQTIPSR